MSDELTEIRRILAGLGHEGEVLPAHELLADLHLDSVLLLSLVVELEDRYRVILAEEDAAGVRTVEDLCALLRRKREVA